LLIVLGTAWDPIGSGVMDSVAAYFHRSLSEWNITRSSAAETLDVTGMRPTLQAAATAGGMLLMAVILISMLQTRGWFVPGFVLPQAARVSPVANARRICGTMATRVFAAAMSLAIGGVIVWTAWLRVGAGAANATVGLAPSVAIVWSNAIQSTTLQLGIGCVVYGLLDLFLRHHRRESQLRMTPAEWAEEQRSAARGPMW
jgi:flagellar biosynthesis protein FlhB